MNQYKPVKINHCGIVVFDALGRMGLEGWGVDLLDRPPATDDPSVYNRDIAEAVALRIAEAFKAQFGIELAVVHTPVEQPAGSTTH